MSDLANTNKDESNVDFTDDVQKPEEQMTMEELDKIRESIDTQGEEEMNRVKKLAEENKEKIDAAVQLPASNDNIEERSVFVKEVDYSVTPTQLMDYFSTCGSITRLKILTTRAGAPKGAAYIEFADPDSVKSALLFNGNVFSGRKLVVEPKRKNLPRYMLRRGRGRGGYHRPSYRPKRGCFLWHQTPVPISGKSRFSNFFPTGSEIPFLRTRVMGTP